MNKLRVVEVRCILRRQPLDKLRVVEFLCILGRQPLDKLRVVELLCNLGREPLDKVRVVETLYILRIVQINPPLRLGLSRKEDESKEEESELGECLHLVE